MYNAKYIIPGIIITIILLTSPFWLNIGTTNYVYPEVSLPKGKDMDTCIEPKEWMRINHMNLLNQWRDEATREGNHIYTATDDRTWEISLQNTCMKCHTSKTDFCDKCHNSNNVQPYCWTCHIAPREKQ